MLQGFIILLIIVVLVAIKSVKIVKQSEVLIVERLGRYYKTAEAGLNIILPFIDHVRARVDLREQTMDVQPQSVITKDNVTIRIDTVVFFQITEARNAVYEIQNLQNGIKYLTTTTMRDIIGKMELDTTLSSREQINSQLRQILDEATDKWRCKVNRVEIKDIDPPKDIREAMEKQMNAERNKRAVILEADGQKQAAITIAEGEKESKILQADAEKETNIRKAEGDRQARILRATGEAEAIKQIAEAKAQEIERVYNAIKNSNPDDKLVQIKALEALEEVSKGAANKVFIPFDATGTLAGLGALKEITKE